MSESETGDGHQAELARAAAARPLGGDLLGAGHRAQLGSWPG
ncbi:hypothetical protein [Vermiculatibacterium agrestimuris]|nr:hypothetical protein [Vermiculatibacterium agrestimuris]